VGTAVIVGLVGRVFPIDVMISSGHADNAGSRGELEPEAETSWKEGNKTRYARSGITCFNNVWRYIIEVDYSLVIYNSLR
jgi:hypothetical protein